MKSVYRLRKHIPSYGNTLLKYDVHFLSVLPPETIPEILHLSGMIRDKSTWVEEICANAGYIQYATVLKALSRNPQLSLILLQNRRFQNFFFNGLFSMGKEIRLCILGCIDSPLCPLLERHLAGYPVKEKDEYLFKNMLMYFGPDMVDFYFRPPIFSPYHKSRLQMQWVKVIVLLFATNPALNEQYNRPDYWQSLSIHLWTLDALESVLQSPLCRPHFKPHDLLTSAHVADLSRRFPDWILLDEELVACTGPERFNNPALFSVNVILPFLDALRQEPTEPHPPNFAEICAAVLTNPHPDLMTYWKHNIDVLESVLRVGLQHNGYLHRGSEYVHECSFHELERQLGFQTIHPEFIPLLQKRLPCVLFAPQVIDSICLLYRNETHPSVVDLLRNWVPVILTEYLMRPLTFAITDASGGTMEYPVPPSLETRRRHYWIERMAASVYSTAWFLEHPPILKHYVTSFSQNPSPDAKAYLDQLDECIDLGTTIDCAHSLAMFCELDYPSMRRNCKDLALELLWIVNE